MLFSRAETKRLLCFRPLRQRQKQSLPATRPSQVGWLRLEWRSPIGRPDHPYRCFKCASFETQLRKATLILKGKQLMEGYKGRWSETEEGGRANQLTQRQSMGRQQYAQASWRAAAKSSYLHVWDCFDKEMRGLWGCLILWAFLRADRKILTLCNSTPIHFFVVMDHFLSEMRSITAFQAEVWIYMPVK